MLGCHSGMQRHGGSQDPHSGIAGTHSERQRSRPLLGFCLASPRPGAQDTSGGRMPPPRHGDAYGPS